MQIHSETLGANSFSDARIARRGVNHGRLAAGPALAGHGRLSTALVFMADVVHSDQDEPVNAMAREGTARLASPNVGCGSRIARRTVNGNHFGARWWRFDFHAHTPASYDYGKGPQQYALKSISPREWLLSFMRNSIDCVAITDHNVANWIDPLKAAYAALRNEGPAEFRPLYLFPGVEVSVYDNVHLLAVFSPDCDALHVDRFLGATGISGGTPLVSGRCTVKSLPEVSRLITEHGGIAIPAHADASNGLFYPSHQAAPLQSPDLSHVDAVEIVNRDALTTLSSGTDTGPLAFVLGSDSHHPSGTKGQRFPGSHFTWVKMGTPSIQGLRLALLDGTPLSIQRSDTFQGNPNSRPHLFIRELSIQGAKYAGRGTNLSVGFSPWLTAIIGGRGVGKSTLVEMMRLCLRRETEIPPRLRRSQERFFRVPQSRSDSGALTDNTQIELKVEKNSAIYRLRWDTGGKTIAISRQDDLGRWTPEPGEVKNRFRVRLFSQRQVLELATDRLSILRMIDESHAVRASEFHNRHLEIEATFLSLQSQIRKLESNTTRHNQLLGELADIEQKLRIIEKGKRQEILVTHRRLKRQSMILKRIHRELIQTVQDIRGLADKAEPADVREDAFSKTDLGELKALEWCIEAARAQSSAANSLRQTAHQLDDFRRKWKSNMSSAYKQTRERSKRRFRTVMQRLSEAGIDDPDQYVNLLRRRQVLRHESEELQRDRAKISELRQAAETKKLELIQLRERWNVKRVSFLNDVLRDNDNVQVEVIPFGRNAHEQEREFRKVLQREDGRLAGNILSSDESKGLLVELYRDLPASGEDRKKEILRRLDQQKEDMRKRHTGNGKSWFDQHMQGLQPEQLDRIDLWFPSDSVSVSYKRPDGKGWSPIDGGSPGQRSAALLALILADGDEPLILDQPEDDLDNRLVYDLIVQQVRRTKRTRQIIVVTHNPNIVVNGDAEGVIEMDFRKGQCVVVQDGTGCLQDQGTRDTICRVMEGGRSAFLARHKRLAMKEE